MGREQRKASLSPPPLVGNKQLWNPDWGPEDTKYHCPVEQTCPHESTGNRVRELTGHSRPHSTCKNTCLGTLCRKEVLRESVFGREQWKPHGDKLPWAVLSPPGISAVGWGVTALAHRHQLSTCFLRDEQLTVLFTRTNGPLPALFSISTLYIQNGK